jgi:hypothetical protein
MLAVHVTVSEPELGVPSNLHPLSLHGTVLSRVHAAFLIGIWSELRVAIYLVKTSARPKITI